MPSRPEAPHLLKLSNQTALALYPDSRPHNLEVAALQKGLVLTHNGVEVIGEGMGFGAVVVKYRDGPYFSKSATVSVQKDGALSKSFTFDSVPRRRIWGGHLLHEPIYTPLHRAFEEHYLKRRSLRPLFYLLMEVKGQVGLRTEFTDTEPKGRVTALFKMVPEGVWVDLDLRELDRRGCEEVLVLNEQSATVFTRYLDSRGLRLRDGEIGAWGEVEGEEAALLDLEGRCSFRVRRLPVARLYRGWEWVRGRLDWAGLDYSLKPETSRFTYTVEVRCS